MPTLIFEAEGGFTDGVISYLSGIGAPGGDGLTQDDAAKGSRYIDINVPLTYQKITAGTGTDKWAVEVAAGEKVVESIEQTAHGFGVGNWAYLTSTGFAKADASDVDLSDAIGVIESVADVNNFTIVTSGFSDVTFNGTTGNALFLDQSTVAGATITKPETGVQKNLGFIKDNKIFIAIDITIDISDDDAPSVPLVIVTSVTTIQAVDSLVVDDENAALWLLEASSSNGRFTGLYSIIHNGFGASDATATSLLPFGTHSIGAAITGLAIGVALTGSGVTQMLDLTVVSTSSVDVRVRRLVM